MKFVKTKNLLGCAVLAAMASSVAMADDVTGWYIGGNLGQGRVDIDQIRMADTVTPGFANRASSEDDKDFGLKLFGGYQYNPHFALEFGYFNLGQYSFRTATNPLGTLRTSLGIHGINLDAVGTLPLNDQFSIIGRVGVNYANVKDSFSVTGLTKASRSAAEAHDSYPKLGLGLQYSANENLGVRFEVERYRFNNGVNQLSDADLYSVGVVYRFGSAPKPAPVVVAPPAPAPAPAPVVEPPPAPKFEKYTLSSTELFGFDSSVLSLPQPKLEAIAKAIQGPGAPQQIVINGYTDHLGSDVYNQKLSERRAQAVKDFIVSKGVSADRVIAVGKGETDPVVQCAEKNKAELIACLAPNRRVEIDEVQIVREVKPAN